MNQMNDQKSKTKRRLIAVVGVVALGILLFLALRMKSSGTDASRANEPETSTSRASSGAPAVGTPAAEAQEGLPAATDQVENLLQALKKDLPPDAADVLERFAMCLHFGGEERYDEEKSAEIDEVIDRYHCATVVDDRDLILKKYESEPKVKAAFDEAESAF